VPFLSLVSVAELHRNPTVKAEAEAAGDRAPSGLLLTYPVHQAADILFRNANLVPVGRDQLPHLKLTRTIARRFNQRYAAETPLFPNLSRCCRPRRCCSASIGRKMSKSRGNGIALRDDEDRTAALLRRARTDGERQITYEPGRRPEVANLLRLAALCSDRTPEQVAADVGDGGASALKAVVTDAVNERLRPIRSRRAELAPDPAFLLDVLTAGNAVANDLADATLRQVRQLMPMQYRPVG
jgi:tryptophanyl-tRNA synthetase